MNKNDIKIIACLRQNGRMPLTKLAKRTGVPVSTLFDRIRATRAIERHAALLDFQALGFCTKAVVLVRTTKERKEELHRFLQMHFNVNNLCKINNGYDFCFECIFRGMNEMEGFLEHLDERFELRSKHVHYVIKEIKREAFLADPQTAEMVFQ